MDLIPMPQNGMDWGKSHILGAPHPKRIKDIMKSFSTTQYGCMQPVAALASFHHHHPSTQHTRRAVLRAAFRLHSPLLQRSDEMDTWAVVGVSLFAAAAAAALLVFVAMGLSLALQPTWAVRWLQKHTPNILYLKQTEELVVSLTIDDGPHKDITPELLDILKKNDCQATWFIIGSNMDSCPGLVERIIDEGHEVGNHTMFDVASWQLPLDVFEEQLLDVDNRLSPFYHKDKNGSSIKWFRPGHGFYTKKMIAIAESYGYRTALGSLFPLDTIFTNQGKRIGKYLLRRIHPGAVILLHDRGPQKLQTAEVVTDLYFFFILCYKGIEAPSNPSSSSKVCYYCTRVGYLEYECMVKIAASALRDSMVHGQ